MIKSIKKNLIVLGLGILAILALIVITNPIKANAQNYTGGSTVEVVAPNVTSVSQSSVSQKGFTELIITGSNFMPGSIVRLNGSDYTSLSTKFIDSSHLFIKLDLSKISVADPLYISVVNPASYFVGGSKYSNAITYKVSATPNTSPNIYNGTNDYNNYNTSNNNGSYNNYNQNNSGQTQNSNGYNSNNGSNGNNGGNTGGDISSLASNAIFGTNSFSPSGIIQWVLFAIIILLLVIIVRKFFGGEARYHETPLKHA